VIAGWICAACAACDAWCIMTDITRARTHMRARKPSYRNSWHKRHKRHKPGSVIQGLVP